jgi:hypothetical protein
MNHHTHIFSECRDHSCDTCQHEQQKEIPCVCCYNDGGSDNCYWEPKNKRNIFNSDLFQNDLEENERKFNEKIAGNCIIDMLKLLSNEQRLEVFSHFCAGCGDIQPEGKHCQCRNDE